jgi:hypothetical protein
MDYFPEEEKNEAWTLLRSEYESAKAKSGEEDADNEREIIIADKVEKESKKRKEISELNNLFQAGKKNKKKKSREEIERWEELEEINDIDQDVLVWWKLHEKEYPILSQIAKKYLCIPASQAITERSFSTAKRIVCDSRTRLKPEHVSKLVVWHQSSVYFEDK